MALTIMDILKLPALRNFRLIAGNNGLNRDITSAGIVDYEFVKGIDCDLNTAFEKDSLVISSLLFAKDDSSLILPAIKQLDKAGVAAFVFKSVFFETLPDEVISYAEINNFPIFSYKDGTWFENIIFDVMNAIEKDDTRYLSQSHIKAMIQNTINQDEIDDIRMGISLSLNKTVSAAYIKLPQLDSTRILRAYYMLKNLREKTLISKYNDGIFVLITTSTWNDSSHRIILSEICESLALPVSTTDLVLSRIHPAIKLNHAFREAYYGWLTTSFSFRKTLSYDSLGVYSAILPLSSSPELKSYASSYLYKLKGYEQTIESYINNGGDIVATSVDLNCHANTIRYRLNKMKSLVGSKNETDHELFRDLSIAYAIHVVSSKDL